MKVKLHNGRACVLRGSPGNVGRQRGCGDGAKRRTG